MRCVYHPEEPHTLSLPSTSPNSVLLRRALGLDIRVEKHLHVSEKPVLAVLDDLGPQVQIKSSSYEDFVVQDSLWTTLPKHYRQEIYQRTN